MLKTLLLYVLLVSSLLFIAIFILNYGIYDFNRDASNYDTRAYFIVALNPFVKNNNVEVIRYLRFLYSFLVFLIAGGNPYYTAITLVVVNIIFYFLSVLMVFKQLSLIKKESMVIFYIFNPFLAFGIVMVMPDPLFLFLLSSNMYFFLIRREKISGLFLILAVLTRPITIGLSFYYLIFKSKAKKLSSILPYIPLILLILYFGSQGGNNENIISLISFLSLGLSLIPILSILNSSISSSQVGVLFLIVNGVMIGINLYSVANGLKTGDGLKKKWDILNIFMILPTFFYANSAGGFSNYYRISSYNFKNYEIAEKISKSNILKILFVILSILSLYLMLDQSLYIEYG